MFITNCNLRKKLGMGRLLNPECGEGTGATGGASGTGEGNPECGEGSGGGEGDKAEPKTFTQEELDSLIKERVAREKKGQLSKEELQAYNTWKESQKTEEEKKSEALTNAEKARLAAEEKATGLEAKVTCLSKGVVSTSVEDVVVLAKAMVSDEVTIEQAIDKVLEKYPSFKGDQQQQEQKGFKVGAGREAPKGSSNDALASIFGNKK